MIPNYRHALIVGSGPGLSASLARLFAAKGLQVSLARRSVEDAPADDDGPTVYPCDAADRASVEALFEALDDGPGAPDVVVYNPSARTRGSLLDLDPEAVERAIEVSAFGAFLVAQAAARRMLPAEPKGAEGPKSEGPKSEGHGALLFTGASASVKGFAGSAPFAMGKFALRGLAQSLARELHPRGVHVGHVIVDGAIRSVERGRVEGADETPDRFLDPDAIAQSYWSLLAQDRSAWSWEIEVRPWVERF